MHWQQRCTWVVGWAQFNIPNAGAAGVDSDSFPKLNLGIGICFQQHNVLKMKKGLESRGVSLKVSNTYMV
jgi:hypothetical protein